MAREPHLPEQDDLTTSAHRSHHPEGLTPGAGAAGAPVPSARRLVAIATMLVVVRSYPSPRRTLRVTAAMTAVAGIRPVAMQNVLDG
jgi:hypothetical protein